METDLELWVAVHQHRYGADVRLFKFAPAGPLDNPDETRVCDICDIDYEPENRDEVLEIYAVNMGTDCPVVTNK